MFNRKTLTVLLLVLFVVSLTASAASAAKVVSLPALQKAAVNDPYGPQGATTPGAVESVKIVEAALVKAGYLTDNSYAKDGSYGTATTKAYKKWQKSLGSSERYCDGIPGKKDLTKLGNKYGFTVDTSTTTKNGDTSKSKSTYNRKLAVEYAHKYVDPLKGKSAYNKSYYAFDSDCTNYISQCLYAGGWKQIGGQAEYKDYRNYLSYDAWYYEGYSWPSSLCKKYSRTWTVADNFYKFCSKHPERVEQVSLNSAKLEPGDIVQMDGMGKNGKPDGVWDHSMVITSKSSNGDLYISAHTSDLEDEPLSSIQNRNPNAKYVGWHIK